MSFKRQLKYKYQNIKFSLFSLRLPNWLISRTVQVGLFLLILIFGGAYIFNISHAATTGYQLKVLTDKNESLQAEVQKLQVEIADNSSINSIATRVTKLNMVESSGVKHVAIKNSSMAKN